jgi:hypothetical protein
MFGTLAQFSRAWLRTHPAKLWRRIHAKRYVPYLRNFVRRVLESPRFNTHAQSEHMSDTTQAQPKNPVSTR